MSEPITTKDISGMPDLPHIGYYNSDKSDCTSDIKNTDPNCVYTANPPFNSLTSLKHNLEKSCVLESGSSWSTQQGIYNTNDDNIKKYLPNGSSTPSLDVPYYLAKEGVLNGDKTNNDISLNTYVSNACSNKNGKTPSNITSQIQYLTCQLEKERNRKYSASTFNINGNTSVGDIFEKFGNLKVFLIFLFFLSFYLFMNGFFGSLDVGMNIFSIIDSTSDSSVTYWCGILFGLIVPFIFLCSVYGTIVCNNLSDLEKYEITNNSYGVKNKIESDIKNFDLGILVLFLFLLYALVAVLFTIKKGSFSLMFYSFFIGLILFIIAIFIYILYAYIPFFNTTSDKEMNNSTPRPLRLFVEKQDDVSNITSNQYQDFKVRKTFLYTFLLMYFLSMGFFVLNKTKIKNSPFLNGMFGSFAILILPALWVFNFFVAINYFYVYPVFLIVFRYIRYFIMSIIYLISEKNSSMKDGFSDELIDQLNDFKNYSPTWGLIGVDEYKIFMNYMGFDNTFSKMILSEYSDNSNLSSNKFVASAFFAPFIMKLGGESGTSSLIMFGIINFVLTIIIASIILFGVLKIQSVVIT